MHNDDDAVKTQISDENKKGLSDLSPEQKDDVFKVCHILPRLEIKNEVLVEDEEEIAEGDLITIKVRSPSPHPLRGLRAQSKALPMHMVWLLTCTYKQVTVTRANLDEGESAPAVHAPYFPSTK